MMTIVADSCRPDMGDDPLMGDGCVLHDDYSAAKCRLRDQRGYGGGGPNTRGGSIWGNEGGAG